MIFHAFVTIVIHSFSLKNFCSFAEEVSISLLVGKTAPDDERFFPTGLSNRATSLLGVFGANASGKTNLLKGLVFLRWFLLDSYTDSKPDEDIPLDTFAGAKKDHSQFSVTFEKAGVVYRYKLLASQKCVLKDELSRLDKATNRFNYLLKREKKGKSYIVSVGDVDIDQSVLSHIARPNASIFSAARQTGSKVIEKLAREIDTVSTCNITRMGKSQDSNVATFQTLMNLAETLHKEDAFKKRVERVLKRADVGLHTLEIHESKIFDPKTKKTEKRLIPYAKHISPNGDFLLPFALESSGTQALLLIVSRLLKILDCGGVAILDELENDLHPHVLPWLLKLFTSYDTNPKRAQLIFTTHSAEILNTLDKTQVVFVEKSEHCYSSAYRLDEVEGVRRDENVFAKYNSGAYGAIPALN